MFALQIPSYSKCYSPLPAIILPALYEERSSIYLLLAASARSVRQVVDRVFSFLLSAKRAGHENKEGKNEDP